MHEIMEHLAKNPVLVLFLLIGVGMLVGHIKIKGISLGAAAVLFAGIALGAYADFLGVDLKLPQLLGTLGLAIFTFSIGVSSGPGFFQVIKTAAGPLLAMLGVFIVSAGAAQVLGRAFGMNSALIAGTWQVLSLTPRPWRLQAALPKLPVTQMAQLPQPWVMRWPTYLVLSACCSLPR